MFRGLDPGPFSLNAILANVLGVPLDRLPRLAVRGEDPHDLCTPSRRVETLEPEAELSQTCAERPAADRGAYTLLTG